MVQSKALGAVLRARGCPNCRVSILRTFSSIAGVPFSSSNLSVTRPQGRSGAPRKAISSFVEHRQIRGLQDGRDQEAEHKEYLDTEAEEAAEDDFAPVEENRTSIPWYLQVETPLGTPPTLSERQRIPDLPESSPEMLQPLLQQISVDLGLDDLTILDLRKLDPPPALGANLLMIIGTARSEKHLHVSADRLCRWLRSTYKLRPDADGLLGRNELKLKLKRKARRSKLIGAGSMDEEMDDGVRTGWVCVNIGTVAGPAAQVEKEDFVGFGRQTDGVKIVVQMLVEEKRQELDLERLWTGVSKRQTLAEETAEDVDMIEALSTPSSGVGTSGIPSSFSQTSVQSRGIHTRARCMAPQSTLLAPDSDINVQSHISDLKALTQVLATLFGSGCYEDAKREVSDRQRTIAELEGNGWRLYLLEQMKQYLESLPNDNALEEIGPNIYNDLGRDTQDGGITPFTKTFFDTLSLYPAADMWEYKIWFSCYARSLGHAKYGPEAIVSLSEELQLSSLPMPSILWLPLFCSLVAPYTTHTPGSGRFAQTTTHDAALELLQAVDYRGDNVLTVEVFTAIYETLALYKQDYTHDDLYIPKNAWTETFDVPVLPQSEIRTRINSLFFNLNPPIDSSERYINLLHLFADAYDFQGFWKLWRSMAANKKHRSAEMYATMFQRVAEVGHQLACMTVLRNWVPELDKEGPPVKLRGEVLRAVIECLRVVDPLLFDRGVPKDENGGWNGKGEWVALLARCQVAAASGKHDV